MEDADFFYLSLFDTGTSSYREIRSELLNYPFEPQWFGNGCQLFIGGNLLDLNGNIVWQSPELGETIGNFNGTRLSPDREWLAFPVFSGEQTYESAEFVDVGLIHLNEPSLPPTVVSKNGGAEVGAFAWSLDGDWLGFSDYDENGILQIYRTRADEQETQQLTFHTSPIAKIDYLVWSPNSRYIAYAVTNLLYTSLPYSYDEQDEGWVGIISVSDLSARQIRPAKFGTLANKAIWWKSDSSQIMPVGSSLPLPEEDSLAGKQIHWADPLLGTITNSFYQTDAPYGEFGVAVAVGNTDQVLISSRDGFYILNGNNKSYNLLTNVQPVGLIRDVVSAPFDFPGETNCLR